MIAAGVLAAATAVFAALLAFDAPSVPKLPKHPDAAALAIALPTWPLARWELMRALVTAAAFAVAGHAAPLVAPIALVAPSVVLRWRVRVLRDRAGVACLAILQATHAGLRSGLPIVAALGGALAPHSALARAPFEDAIRAFELNADLDEALGAARRRAVNARVITALDALALAAAEDLPASRAATLVASVAERLSFDTQLRSEIEARASGARTQIVILALVVPCLALYLAATMPGLAATLMSPIGARVLIPTALALEIAGILASRAVVADLEP